MVSSMTPSSGKGPAGQWTRYRVVVVRRRAASGTDGFEWRLARARMFKLFAQNCKFAESARIASLKTKMLPHHISDDLHTSTRTYR